MYDPSLTGKHRNIACPGLSSYPEAWVNQQWVFKDKLFFCEQQDLAYGVATLKNNSLSDLYADIKASLAKTKLGEGVTVTQFIQAICVEIHPSTPNIRAYKGHKWALAANGTDICVWNWIENGAGYVPPEDLALIRGGESKGGQALCPITVEVGDGTGKRVHTVKSCRVGSVEDPQVLHLLPISNGKRVTVFEGGIIKVGTFEEPLGYTAGWTMKVESGCTLGEVTAEYTEALKDVLILHYTRGVVGLLKVPSGEVIHTFETPGQVYVDQEGRFTHWSAPVLSIWKPGEEKHSRYRLPLSSDCHTLVAHEMSRQCLLFVHGNKLIYQHFTPELLLASPDKLPAPREYVLLRDKRFEALKEFKHLATVRIPKSKIGGKIAIALTFNGVYDYIVQM